MAACFDEEIESLGLGRDFQKGEISEWGITL